MYVNVVFAIRCLYSTVTLTLVTEQHFTIMIFYYYGCISDPLFLCCAEGSCSAVDPDLALHVFHHVVVLLTQHLQHTTPPSAGLCHTKTKHKLWCRLYWSQTKHKLWCRLCSSQTKHKLWCRLCYSQTKHQLRCRICCSQTKHQLRCRLHCSQTKHQLWCRIRYSQTKHRLWCKCTH